MFVFVIRRWLVILSLQRPLKKYLKLRDKFFHRDKYELYAKNLEKASNECFSQRSFASKEESKASKFEIFDLCSF